MPYKLQLRMVPPSIPYLCVRCLAPSPLTGSINKTVDFKHVALHTTKVLHQTEHSALFEFATEPRKFTVTFHLCDDCSKIEEEKSAKLKINKPYEDKVYKITLLGGLVVGVISFFLLIQIPFFSEGGILITLAGAFGISSILALLVYRLLTAPGKRNIPDRGKEMVEIGESYWSEATDGTSYAIDKLDYHFYKIEYRDEFAEANNHILTDYQKSEGVGFND